MTDQDPATSFTRRQPTRWLSPSLLLRSAGEVVVSGLLGQYNDKREGMGSLPADDALDLRTGRTEVWMDYVSDVGDGFDATYTVAMLLAQPSLTLPAPDGAVLTTRRGQLLVMGGDQCYPSADVEVYEDKLIGPYRAALSHVSDDGQAPLLFAVPGNHDWYDGLTAFMRTFCQHRWVGGWRTRQSRSYFAVKLPGGWWLWGIDIQFDTYIDDVQRRFFEEMAKQLQQDDAIVLCSAKPSWVSTAEDQLEAYSTLDFLERTLIRPRGAHLRICLSGDRHHYVRYEATDGAQRITAGGGGAYLSPTHHLPDEIVIPPAKSRARSKSDPVRFERRGVFPEARVSRRAGRGVFSLPWTTTRFALLLGGIYGLLAVSMVGGATSASPSLLERLRVSAGVLADLGPLVVGTAHLDRLGGLLLALVVLGGAVAFTGRMRSPKGWLLGGVHGLVHLVLAALVVYGAAWLVSRVAADWWFLGLLPAVVVVGGFVATEVFAAYLVVADRWRVNSNELFSAQAIADHKNFLRLHVREDGDLVIYPVGIDRVPRSWKVVEPRDDDRPRFAAADRSPSPALIEEPIVVTASPDGPPR